MSVPNQRIILIKRVSAEVRKEYFKIGHNQLNKVANDLKGNAFKLYIYLANNQNNFILELSSRDFINWSGTSESTYDRAFTELKEKGYLISAPKQKNLWLFQEESKSYEERHKEDKILLSNEEQIKKLFGSK